MANTPQQMLNFIDGMLKGRTVGYAVAIFEGQELVRSTSRGSAVPGKAPTRMTSKTRTFVGSLSKPSRMPRSFRCSVASTAVIRTFRSSHTLARF